MSTMPTAEFVQINGKNVPIAHYNGFQRITESPAFTKWATSISPEIQILRIEVYYSRFVGENLSYAMMTVRVKINRDIELRTVFISSDTYSLFLTVEANNTNGKWALVSQYTRVATGSSTAFELPALRSDPKFGVTPKQLESILNYWKIDANKLVFKQLCAFRPNPHVCTERCVVFHSAIHVPSYKIPNMIEVARMHKSKDPGNIGFRLVKLEELPEVAMEDATTQIAYLHYSLMNI